MDQSEVAIVSFSLFEYDSSIYFNISNKRIFL